MLSWQGQVTGPHTAREIQTLLRVGKIHSLFKIQVEGQWLLLRDHLADVNHRTSADSRRPTGHPATPAASPVPAPQPVADEVALAIPIPTDMLRSGALRTQPAATDEAHPLEEAKGYGIASFVLSLLFFVPYLNGITWLLALIFGHLAVAQADPERRRPTAVLAWVGLWICYVEISFFLLALLWLVALELPPTNWGYLVLHGRLLFSVLDAVLGAGVLLWLVRLTTGCRLGLPECFVGALVPSATAALCLLVVHTLVATDGLARAQEGLVLIGAVNIGLFLTQMFFWASFLRLPDGSKLGLARAALVSLPYTVLFALLGIAYVALFQNW